MQNAGGGAVLNISSIAGENNNKRMAAYASSKAAVNHLTRNIAFDLDAMGVRVNAKTDALAPVLTPETEAAMLKHTPLGRLGEAEDIAYAALFPCAPASAWISGQGGDGVGRGRAGTRLSRLRRHLNARQQRGRGGRQRDPAAIPEEFIRSYKLNTISAYRMSMACLPHLEKAENASITNSGSFSSAVPAYDILPYATAKAALNQMMVSLAHMLNKRLQVNSVLIGTAVTEGYASAGITPEMQERMMHPDNLIGHPGRPYEAPRRCRGVENGTLPPSAQERPPRRRPRKGGAGAAPRAKRQLERCPRGPRPKAESAS